MFPAVFSRLLLHPSVNGKNSAVCYQVDRGEGTEEVAALKAKGASEYNKGRGNKVALWDTAALAP
jgi:hypothetical protein